MSSSSPSSSSAPTSSALSAPWELFKVVLGLHPFFVDNIKYAQDWKTLVMYSFIFLVDLADAVIDLILSLQVSFGGIEGGRGLGLLLGIMTLVSRYVIHLYGKIETPQPIDIVWMEMTVFMLEDGAAILLLAKNPSSSSDVIQSISQILTIICAVSFILGFIMLTDRYTGIVSFRLILSAPVFMLFILIKEVLIKQSVEDDNDPLSGALEEVSYIVYGLGVLLFLYITRMTLTNSTRALSVYADMQFLSVDDADSMSGKYVADDIADSERNTLSVDDDDDGNKDAKGSKYNHAIKEKKEDLQMKAEKTLLKESKIKSQPKGGSVSDTGGSIAEENNTGAVERNQNILSTTLNGDQLVGKDSLEQLDNTGKLKETRSNKFNIVDSILDEVQWICF